MAGLERPGAGLELDLDVRPPSGLEGLGVGARRPVGEVQHAADDERRRAVREHVADLRGQVRDRVVGPDPDAEHGVTEDLEVLGERVPRVGEGQGLVGSLIARLPPRHPARARDPRGGADVAADREGVGSVAVGQAPGLGLVQGEGGDRQALGRPGRLEPPGSPDLRADRVRAGRALRVDDDRRLSIDAGVGSLQPAVPPAEHLRDQVDVRTWAARLDRAVGPGTDQDPSRASQLGERPQRDVRVPVRPAADDHRGGLDRPVVLPERPEPPVVVVALVVEPREQPGLGAGHSSLPLVSPPLAVDRRDRRQGVARDHVRGVVDDVELLHGAAEVVDVVAVAIVAGEDRDDRLERRGPLHRQLERVEPAVAGPEHPHRAARPLLGGEPLDHGEEVGALGGRVLVGRDPLARPGAAHVHTAHDVPGIGQAQILRPVRGGEVVLAVGERLQQGGPRPRSGGRHVQGGGEPDRVGHLDPHVSGLGHRAGDYRLRFRSSG